MTDVQQRTAAKNFADRWKGRGDEKSDTQSFWLSLLRDIFDVNVPDEYIKFEKRVKAGNTRYMDGRIAETLVVIEQKKLGHDLLKAEKQSDDTMLTPFGQAKRYDDSFGRSQRAKWIITCSFDKFHIYDMEDPREEPIEILLENLEYDYKKLDFLVNPTRVKIRSETAVSYKAGEIIEKLYSELLKQCNNPEDPETLRQLNVLCVRLVFCLYAEDAGIFKHSQFHDYLEAIANKSMETVHEDLEKLFEVLNTEKEQRHPYLNPYLSAFPYVNGGLFEDVDVHIPPFNETIIDLLLNEANAKFNWSSISPTIFGALFESTLNPVTRRKGGMHYTSITDIHKVIDPLFLDKLKMELKEIDAKKYAKVRADKLKEFQDKLAGLVFLDPACGSGNFLTQTYLEIRRLENEVIKLRFGEGLIVLEDTIEIIRVSISQFYGFEINNFAVKVAQTALWIAEAQMMKDTEDIIKRPLDFLPLRSYANIFECNALGVNWEEYVPKNKLSYIFGNPPFVGYKYQNSAQKADMLSIYLDSSGKPQKTAGKIDYVAAWYYKAAQFIKSTKIGVAFVSTNSITQGEQVASVWRPLIDMFGVSIHFAHRTFKWGNDAKEQASVYCVIIGFKAFPRSTNIIFDGSEVIVADNINPYLVDGKTIFIENRKTPLCDVPLLTDGNRATDNGNLIIEGRDHEDFITKEPQAIPYIKRYMMAREFLYNEKRYCLWLKDITSSEFRKLPLVRERVELVRKFRESSTKEATVKSSKTPRLFQEIRQPDSDYIVIPFTSSERRDYIPIGYLSKDIIAGAGGLFMLPNATCYHFGILTSNVHMAWIKAVCGRLEMRYRYSSTLVYNNFPWPDATEVQKSHIEKLAKDVLCARADETNSNLADLYDPYAMPLELFKAHENLDKAVMKLYGFPAKFVEAEIVGALMERYRELVENVK